MKNVIQKGTFVKDATSIVFDMKNLLTLGNSVSLEILHLLLNTD